MSWQSSSGRDQSRPDEIILSYNPYGAFRLLQASVVVLVESILFLRRATSIPFEDIGCLAHWGWHKIAAILQTKFSNAFFLNENTRISIKIPLNFICKGSTNNIPTLIQIMAYCRPGDKPLSFQWRRRSSSKSIFSSSNIFRVTCSIYTLYAILSDIHELCYCVIWIVLLFM